VGEGSVNEAN